eukprot:854425-Amphidinium_carterae.1
MSLSLFVLASNNVHGGPPLTQCAERCNHSVLGCRIDHVCGAPDWDRDAPERQERCDFCGYLRLPSSKALPSDQSTLRRQYNIIPQRPIRTPLRSMTRTHERSQACWPMHVRSDGGCSLPSAGIAGL